MLERFDVVVIGGGPAGYVAAIRAAQLGLKVACVDNFVDKDGKASLGGTCLNVGCIPSKALLDSSKHFYNLTHSYKDHGIQASAVSIDVSTMLARKDKIVQQLTGGIATLFKANKVTSFAGHGQLQADKRVQITAHDGQTRVIEATNVVLATGSLPISIPNVTIDGVHIVDNTGALAFAQTPGRLGVIGAGVIGLELGSVWKRLGAQVTVFEALPQFLGAVDADVARAALREFKKQGLEIRLDTKVTGAQIEGNEVVLRFVDSTGEQTARFDKLLVAVGRRAHSAGLLGEGTGVQINARGQIEVDAHCATAVPGIYAVGDCVRGPMLAHKGSEEGIAVAEIIAGKAGHVNLDTVPWVIYTEPEIAWVGKTEKELRAAGIPFKSGSFPFAATGRALAMNEPAGLVKILAHEQTDRILGVHMCGANVSELIAEVVVAMEFQASAEDLARICHAHPTLSEAVHEAALAVDKRAIHRVN